MNEVGFLNMMGVGPKSDTPAPAPVASYYDRFFALNSELEARFPGTEVLVRSYRKSNFWVLECEIEGKRPDGTRVSFKVESRQTAMEPNPQIVEKFFKEIDSWA